MKRVVISFIGALLVGTSGAAMAFDIQQGAQTPPAPETRAAPAAEAPLGADLTMSEPSKAPTGTEVRIPGLGKLGVLPKMDFGLELLYGAADPKQSDAAPEGTAEGVVVRGTVKHRF